MYLMTGLKIAHYSIKLLKKTISITNHFLLRLIKPKNQIDLDSISHKTAHMPQKLCYSTQDPKK